jgi:hypothetical protein
MIIYSMYINEFFLENKNEMTSIVTSYETNILSIITPSFVPRRISIPSKQIYSSLP